MVKLYSYNSAFSVDTSLEGGGVHFLYSSQDSQGYYDGNHFHFTPVSTPSPTTVSGNGAHGIYEGSGFSTSYQDGDRVPNDGDVDRLVVIFDGSNTNDVTISGLSQSLVVMPDADWGFFQSNIFNEADQIWGSLENGDNLNGYGGDDEIIGDYGNDILRGGDGNDEIYGDDKGATRYRNNSTSDVTNYDPDAYFALYGDNDMLFGDAGDDMLFGGVGNDVLQGGAGADSIDGGTGLNTASYSESSEGVDVNLDTGSHSGGDAAGDTLVNIQHLEGSDHDDKLVGDGADNKLMGGSGDDTLDGGAGNDTLDGGTGTDWLYVTGSANSVVNLAKATAQNTGYGTDIIKNIENASGGKGVDKFYGTGGNNILKGNNGNDVLSGKNGNDKLYGGNNNDKLYGGNNNDKLYGGDNNDKLYGGNNNDKLYGGNGNDLLKGSAGRDILRGDAGKDTMFGGSGADTFVFRKTSDSKVNASKADVIKDFQQGQDHIDLHFIDASTKISGNNAFTFDGTKSFGTSKQGDVYYEKLNNAGTANDYTMVYIDTDNDRGTEMSIKLMGLHNLTADDFIL
jgi:Ca2+-binding RTX toxin-like protein